MKRQLTLNPNTNPARILFLNQAAVISGGEIALFNLVSRLDRTRFEPIVLFFADGPLVSKFAEIDVEVIVLELPSKVLNTRKESLDSARAFSVDRLLSVVQYTFALSNRIRQLNPALVHCNSLKSDIIGGIAARLAGKPVIWHVRDIVAFPYLPTRVATGFRLLCRIIPRHIFAVSRAVFDSLALPPHVSERGTIVLDGCDCSGPPRLRFEPVINNARCLDWPHQPLEGSRRIC